ncbi:hypothetical protein GGR56DRAFT_303029 [Xylariaceae sp. FL0804]|nr:hypothetical protein GGR56DRAFT_303029 [Xylariaceae sp. FL0804]
MDFASLMSKEIAKAKPPAPAPAADAADPNSTTATSIKNHSSSAKYIKRGEAEAARQAAYRAEQAALEERRAARLAEKRKREDDAAEEARAREERRRALEDATRRRREERDAEQERQRRRRLGLPDRPPPGEDEDEEDGAPEDGDGLGDLGDDELRAALRREGEPAVLFGETRRARLRRLRRLTTVVTRGPIPTTLRLVDERDMKVSGEVPADRAGRAYLFRQLASYFTMVLSEWEAALARESSSHGGSSDGTSFAGRAAVNAMVSSRENMVPLFRRFEKGDLDDDILRPVVEIVQAAQERRYVDANDGYLRLSIGKAAWPIGVTMVGIHERSAREKLHNGERGHVMGDEVTRKYLQSIKRCLTFAQVRWPPEDIRQLMG